jgi:CRP-like cAMP-binding protein
LRGCRRRPGRTLPSAIPGVTTIPRGISLLDEDPELGVGLPAEDLPLAHRVLVVQGLAAEPGPWALEEPEPSLGLLLLDGLVTVNVVVGDRVASELAGPGDVLHGSSAPHALLPAEVGLVVTEPTRLAVLDERFIAAARRWPVLLLTLHERLRVQQRRLAVHAAIGKLRRVEDRVLALLWHLAERWGRVSSDGVVVPLSLTHETLGRLAGAERPTVTLALGELARTNAVTRRPDGSFVLGHDSAAALSVPRDARHAHRPLSAARTVLPAAGTPHAGERSPLIDTAALQARIDALHADFPDRVRSVQELLASAAAARERSVAVRERVATRHTGAPDGRDG